MDKNEIVTVTAENLGTQGEGIAHLGDLVLFVPFLLPGERADVRILKRKDRIAYGKIEAVLAPAEERVRPRCKAFGRCGGCRLQHMRYREQLRYKTELVRTTLRKLADITFPVSPCERSDREYGYRNKLQLPVGRRNGQNVIGFYAERSHRIVPTDECPIHPAWAGAVISALTKFMETCGLDGYDEESGTGVIRHIVVRELRKRYLVTLVVTEEVKGIDYFVHLLDAIFPEYSLFLNFNTERTNVVFGERFVTIKGPASYECTDMGISFEAGPNTFVQVNDGVREKMYQQAAELVGEGPVIDCYAGGGLLTALFAKRCARAYGIEEVAEASACADRLKVRNGLENMENICGRVEDCLSPLLAREREASLVLDPPRAGLARSVVREILAAHPKKIVMISCNPSTLARDLGLLTGTLAEDETGELRKTKEEGGMYEIGLIQPYDMFPQTRHIETLVLLSERER